ncbi:MAG: polyketide synthase, partial [Desulfobacteraceae bacterium]
MTNSQPYSIAIVGLSGVFPGACDCHQFWRNIRQKVDATQTVSEGRWAAPFDWVSSNTFEIDKAYCRKACLVDHFDFDPSGFNLPKELLRDMDPMCQWGLHASKEALGKAQIDPIDKRRIGVILAAIALPTQISSSISRDIMGYQLAPDGRENVAAGSVSRSLALSGRVVGIPAAIISQGLGLGGVNYTLDAACASSLYAIKLACDELQSLRADAMVAGGVSRPDCLYTQIGFSQLRALSPSGRCAPFDHSADGLVVGEGAGIIVLKRLDDAVAHGDTIHGVIRGIGISNDMRGNLLAPESHGQVRAMRSAYAQAGWRPYDVDYIECHGAGTPVGDATELQSLRTLWGEHGWKKGQCSIGSVKSMIGHLLTAAGAAGMIKMLLALSHRTLPPSLKYKGPKPGSPLIDGPFRVETDARNWPRKQDGATRKAAVSAFGFGGINAHVLIEEWQDHISDRDRPAAIDISEEKSKPSPNEAIAIVGLNLQLGVLDSVNAFQEAVFNGRSAIGPVPPERWKAPKYTDQVFGSEIQGNFIDKVSVELGEFQIPPGEIPDILPQQLLMLKVAAGAMTDAGLPLRQARERMGAIIGIGFDYEATNFQLRWALPSMAARWNETSTLPESGDENLNRWLHCAKDDCGSPLTATRTLGALGGIVASRIAREFRFGGPSFVVSAEEASGLQAAGIASRMLRSREVDAMLVGAVDLNCDERNMTTLYSRLGLSACAQIRPFDTEADGTLPGEGAVALVLKRLEDAKADNDRVYALLEGFGAASGVVDDHFWPDESVYLTSLERAFKEAHADPGEIDVMECHASGVPSQDRIEAKALRSCFDIASTQGTGQSAERSIAVGTVKPIVGHTGATSGLTSLAKTALSLFHHIIPPASHFQKPAQSQWEQGNFYFPIKPVYWARNRQDGPRRACVATMTSDGHCMHVVLGQHDTQCRHLAEPTNLHLHSRPLGALPHGLFIIQGEDKIQMGEGLARLDNLVKNHT